MHFINFMSEASNRFGQPCRPSESFLSESPPIHALPFRMSVYSACAVTSQLRQCNHLFQFTSSAVNLQGKVIVKVRVNTEC